MTTRVALGGPPDLCQEWAGLLLGQLDRTVPADFSYSRETLDVRERHLDSTLTGADDDSRPTWSEEAASRRVERIRRNSEDLQLLLLPDATNEYLDVLLDPVTHLVIVTETRNSDLFSTWFRIAADHTVAATHQVITDEGGGSLYEWTDDDIVKICVPPTSWGDRPWEPRSEAVEYLADDLIELANRGD